LLIAFTYCLKHQLRKTDMHGDLDRLLPASERNSVLNSHSPCNTLLLKMGMWLGEQRRLGRISDINFHSIDNNLNHLSSILGGCERISNTPIPFAYSLIVHRTVYLFCALLPFALVSDLHYLTPLVSVFISYTFISLDSLAEELEDPFGLAPNDLPLNAISATIEINLREMIEDDEKPTPMKPDHHCLLS
ncbi:MAG: bestrophin family ion channel, partial [Hafnia sp.]